jgi:hypothetical protein
MFFSTLVIERGPLWCTPADEASCTTDQEGVEAYHDVWVCTRTGFVGCRRWLMVKIVFFRMSSEPLYCRLRRGRKRAELAS